MKGLILLPERFKDNYFTVQRYMPLFELCKKELGFQIIFAKQININSSRILDKDIIITFKIVQKSDPDCMRHLWKLDKRIKLITYHTDVHNRRSNGFTSRVFKKNMNRILERSDKILCSYDYAFRKMWPDFVPKYEFFPQFFAPYEQFKAFRISKSPIKKCFLSGHVNPFYYPLRRYLYGNKDKAGIVYSVHPGYGKNIRLESLIGTDFIKKMHKYFCSVATSSRFDYVLAKYFEIPALGVLLIANHTPDLDKLGFKNLIHYVQIDRANALERIDYILSNAEEFEHIRRAGRDLVLENHSEINRFERLKEIINELFN